MKALFDGQGRWVWTGRTEDETGLLAGVGAGAVMVDGHFDDSYWWSGATVAPRPSLPAISASATVGVPFYVPELPNDAAVRVVDDEGVTVATGVIANNTLPITFGAPGPFTIHIGEGDTAFPYMPRSYAITVADP